ncbi:MAG TPA: alpha-amylase family glycosyl hydrolase, partial [Gammaproteobacteria bacterium]|nr:alpha-amylase family glycosyl hydrolase [Gammaproteobacteria bacterium]
ENQYASFITNHDQDRVMSVLRGDSAKARLAASLLLTAPGVPFVYYGEEIGLTGEKPDERIRTPMPWSGARHGGFTRAAQPWQRLEKAYEARNVASQSADSASLLNHYRRLIHLRNAHPALLHGGFRGIDTGRDDVIAWERSAGQERLTVVANLSAQPMIGFVLRDRSASEELLHAAPLTDGQLARLDARTLYVLRTVSGDEGREDRKTSR